MLDNSFTIAIGVDPDGRTFPGQAIEFGEHVEVNSMCAEEDVAGQGPQSGEGVVEISRNAWVSGGPSMAGDEWHTGIEGPSTDDDDIESAATFMRLHGPRGAAPGMSGCLVSGDGGAAQGDGVVVMQRAIHARPRKVRKGGIEVGRSTGLEDIDVAVHDHVLGVGLLKDLGCASGVIVVCLAAEEDLCICPAKAELFDAAANLRGGRLEVGVDEDVAFRGNDKIGGQIARSDIVEVARDLEWSDRSGPVGGHSVARCDREGEEECKEESDFHLMARVARGGTCGDRELSGE